MRGDILDNNTMNIMAVVNKKYLSPMMAMFQSLLSNHLRPMRFFLFYSDLDEALLADLKAQFQKENGKMLIPFCLKTDELEGLPVTENLPAEIYFKLVGLDLLPETVEKILCLDLDMIVKAPLDEMYDVDISGYTLAACKDIYAFVYGEGLRNNRRLGLPEEYDYFNAGLLLFNMDRIRSFGGGKAVLEECFKHRELLKWPEQDMLNLLFHENYFQLPWIKYNCPPIMYIMRSDEVNRGVFNPLTQEMADSMSNFDGYADFTQAIAESAAIIHYIGESKPWREGRPEARTYQIFDVYYNQYRN